MSALSARACSPEELAWLIRRDAIEMAYHGHSSHIASALSVADILAVLYSGAANVSSKTKDDPNRDRIILSKGHAGSALYAALAETGFFDRSILLTHYQNGSILSGHISCLVPGVEISTGSLGHGLSIGSGIAYGLKERHSNSRVFVIMGDGECDEGAVWECAGLASRLVLNNLVAFIDRNHQQGLGDTEQIIPQSNLEQKMLAFGWNVQTVDGNDIKAIQMAIENAKQSNKPSAIVCETIKGKGVSFMENNLLWHYRYPHEGGEYEGAVQELLRQKPDNLVDPYPMDLEAQK